MESTRMQRRWVQVAVAAILIAAGFALRAWSEPVYAGLLITAAAVAGTPIAVRAVRDLRIRRVGIEALVTIAAIGAVVIGEVWEAAAVTGLFALGGALEAMTMGRTRRALALLLELVPETATVRRDGAEVAVAPAEVGEGETVIVRPGHRIPVDGQVLLGRAAVDEQTVTGESMPVEKQPGSEVYAGTTAAGGVLEVRADRVGADTALGRIIHRVEEAQEHKVPAQRFLERFARWYTPGVVVLAVVAGLLTGDVRLALTLLVIACPGALVISIPISVVAGVGRGARRGILVKGGEHLEQAAKVTAVAFDKTGTLTEGRPEVAAVEPLDDGIEADELLRWAATVELGSEHPLATPIIERARAAGLGLPERPDAFVAHEGGGVQATVDGSEVLVGTPMLLSSAGIDVGPEASAALERHRSAGRTTVLLARGARVVGVIALADRVRDDAARAVADLARAGVRRRVMLTGDAAAVGHAVAEQVGIDEVHAELSPEDKLAVIRALQAEGERVAMFGDGVNDAPALATADVGIAVGATATPVAMETADVALTTGRLVRASEAIHLARRTVRIMRQNVTIALATVAVLLTGVLAGEVHMAGGMLVHQASVLAVILNALRLLRSSRNSHERNSHENEEPESATAGARRRVTDDEEAMLTS
ncbi:cation-translocating P-type ATPase [Egibacter rhizosphaerae]|uniref:Cation-translocating P-type ATPase n=2 Tax=Egibacter rhizosphaerae TaxID=1670831 RepID=A0A411YLM4_9ACTN|nr:cation-translocating P-type ATPase [Egibacter rhizosphaerae]